MSAPQMTAMERRGAFSLAAVYATRMMGLFMILPVFALYAEHLGSPPPSHALVGLAIGVYGLSQALLQIPFGLLSDRIGRKPVIIGGLILFAAGSAIAATADTITGIIIGRALQGSGAIAAAILALAADLTRESCRARVMATIGMSIGLSFAISLALGPILDSWIGVPGIFWLTVGLAALAILLILFAVPTPARTTFHRDAEPAPVYFKAVIGNPELRRLDLGIFILHMTLTATFIGLPLALRDLAGLVPEHHGYLYLPILLLALFMMVPLVIIAEKQRKIRQVYQFGILGICLSQIVLVVGYHSLFMIVAALLVFFICFNVLEALLPSLVVKFAPPQMKGTATGVYSTSQFLGAFCGGAVGGLVATWAGIVGIFVMSAIMTAVWYLIARGMANPPPLTSQMLNIGTMTEERARELEQELLGIEGVAESFIVPEEGIAYLKVDSKVVDGERLEQYLAPEHKEA